MRGIIFMYVEGNVIYWLEVGKEIWCGIFNCVINCFNFSGLKKFLLCL